MLVVFWKNKLMLNIFYLVFRLNVKVYFGFFEFKIILLLGLILLFLFMFINLILLGIKWLLFIIVYFGVFVIFFLFWKILFDL